jgi:deoxyuridine 5'-triphosphate nucleotidohydrolase
MAPLFVTIDPDNSSNWKNHPTYASAKKNEDVGLDIPMQSTIVVPGNVVSFKVNLQFKANPSHGYMLVPRSSLGSKTTIRMSNSIGIIDKKYRGYVTAVVDNIGEKDIVLQEGACYFQIVAFDGRLPRYQIDKVSVDTSRGEGGFGSTTVEHPSHSMPYGTWDYSGH